MSRYRLVTYQSFGLKIIHNGGDESCRDFNAFLDFFYLFPRRNMKEPNPCGFLSLIKLCQRRIKLQLAKEASCVIGRYYCHILEKKPSAMMILKCRMNTRVWQEPDEKSNDSEGLLTGFANFTRFTTSFTSYATLSSAGQPSHMRFASASSSISPSVPGFVYTSLRPLVSTKKLFARRCMPMCNNASINTG